MSHFSSSESYKQFSLTGKLIAVLIFWISCCFSYWSWHSYDRQQTQLENNLETNERLSANIFKTLLEEKPTQLIRITETLLIGSPVTTTDSVSSHTELEFQAKNLAQNWDQYSMSWALRSAVILDRQAQPIIQLGTQYNIDEEHTEWVENIEKTMEPTAHLHCRHQCMYHIGVPIFGENGLTGTLFSKVSFADTLINLQNQTHSTIGVIRKEKSLGKPSKIQLHSIPKWQASILSIPKKDIYTPIIDSLSQAYTLTELQNARSINFKNGKNYYRIQILQLNDGPQESAYLISFSDISKSIHAINKSLQANIIFSIIATLIFAIIITASLWRSVRRIQRQANLLTLLGQGQYKHVRSQLPKQKNSRFNDELDELESSTISLSYQLEQMQAQLHERAKDMEQLALYDSLTQLPNRHHFLSELTDAIASIESQEDRIALLYFDLDKFKRVNDSLGHMVGDELLINISQRLQRTLKPKEFIARIGGDEFAMVIKDTASKNQYTDASYRIAECFGTPINLANVQILMTTSIGIAFAEHHSVSPHDLVKNADLAMYKAKETGRNQHCIFDTKMELEATHSLQLESELQLAFIERQFELFFQPKVDLNTYEITGFEALVRWRHPERNLLGPAEFIESMELSGQIFELDNWVVQEACIVLERWWSDGIKSNIAVNISSHQFSDSLFAQKVAYALNRYKIGSNKLEIEITESLLMENFEAATCTIQQLTELGITISLDDFGTGYSSLSYINKLPVDIIKIDREFIKNIDTDDNKQAVFQAIQLLAKQMNRGLIAEGIETQEQLNYLNSHDCPQGQGYYFSKPVCETEAIQLLTAKNTALSFKNSASGS